MQSANGELWYATSQQMWGFKLADVSIAGLQVVSDCETDFYSPSNVVRRACIAATTSQSVHLAPGS